MGTWIDIPEIQLLAVLTLGLAMGYVALDYLLKRPFLFVLVAGLLFFGIRFIPAVFALDSQAPGTIPGNGILSAAIMWVVFFGAMLLGRTAAHKAFSEV